MSKISKEGFTMLRKSILVSITLLILIAFTGCGFKALPFSISHEDSGSEKSYYIFTEKRVG